MEYVSFECDAADMENLPSDNQKQEIEGADANSPEFLRNEIEKLRQKEEEILKEKLAAENDFSSKRARFMNLFKQKEDELESEREVAALLQSECDSYVEQISKLQREMDEYKSQIVVMECTRENEMDDEKVKVQQELASLHQVIRDTLAESTRTKKESEREVKKLKKIIEKLENENQEIKSQTSSESKEGVLSAMTKTLAKKVSGLNAYSQSNENIHENLEESMKKAQEDAEVLRSLVVPLEEEIRALKEKLRTADDKIQAYENAYKSFENSTEASSDSKSLNPELDGKLKGLHEGLQAEKSSRSDLEMYVSVLQGQKATLLCDADDLRKQLRDVCHLMEKEKREHNELKQTWQMANDQFLETQKIHAEDMKRMNDILTMEQQRILAGMKRESREQSHPASAEAAGPENSGLKRSSPISFLTSPHRRKSPSPARLSGSFMEKSTEDKIVEDILAETDHRKSRESVSSESDLGSDLDTKVQVTSVEENKLLPSEKEWLQFQDELKNAKEKLSQPCDMCANYETQLQKSQDVERDLRKVIKTYEQSNEWLKSDLENEQQTRKGLEETLARNATEVQDKLAEVYRKTDAAEKTLNEQKQLLSTTVQDTNNRLKELTTNREVVETELKKLRQDNEILMGKYLANSNQLQNEAIDLPNSVSELQEMHLRLREDLIVTLTAKQHTEEVLRSEMLVMKERAQGEQQIRESTESMLMQEIDNLRQNVGILESMKSTYEQEENRRLEMEQKFSELQKKSAETQAMHKTILNNLQKKVEERTKEKERSELEVNELKFKLHSLQKDLDSGEEVQRDFVKLSQSLQVQLESIRKAEEEKQKKVDEDIKEKERLEAELNELKTKISELQNDGQLQ